MSGVAAAIAAHWHCGRVPQPHVAMPGCDCPAQANVEGPLLDHANATDLTAQPFYRWLEKSWHHLNTVKILLTWWFGGWQALCWTMCVPLVVGWHATFFVNSASHIWGSRPYVTGEASAPWKTRPRGPGGGNKAKTCFPSRTVSECLARPIFPIENGLCYVWACLGLGLRSGVFAAAHAFHSTSQSLVSVGPLTPPWMLHPLPATSCNVPGPLQTFSAHIGHMLPCMTMHGCCLQEPVDSSNPAHALCHSIHP
jgi:hypothetical protein